MDHLGTLEVVLDKGQDEDWFGSRMIVYFSIIAVVSLVSVVIWELRHPQPIINLRILKDRNFRYCALTLFFAFGVLYGSTVLLPELMQLLMGYSATKAGMVMSPAGFFTMLEMPLIGIMLGRRVDARWLIMLGLATVGFAAYWMSTLSLEAGPYQLIVPRIVQTLGAGMLWVPGNTAAYIYLSRDQTSNASGLFNLIRNEGSSIGVSFVTTMLARSTQMHQNYLAGHVHALSAATNGAVQRMTATVLAQTGDPVLSQRRGLQMIYSEVQRQALAMSYFDMFRFFAFASFAVIPLVLLMRRSVSEKGAGTGAH
jgi:DHA2 family multidrug resistance protein